MIRQEHLDLLIALNTDENPHSGGELLDHLKGTHDYLEAWGNDQVVCLGGLFHSIYGTQSYKTESATPEDRGRIREVIGEKAERLAYLFCMTKRQDFFAELGKDNPMLWDRGLDEKIPVTQEELHNLVEIEMANYIEFMPRLDFTHEELDMFKHNVERGKHVMSQLAYMAINEAIVSKRQRIDEEANHF